MSLGFLAQMLFSAIQSAGELIDLSSGFTLASLYDPVSNISVSMFGRVHQLVAVTLLSSHCCTWPQIWGWPSTRPGARLLVGRCFTSMLT